MCTLTYFRYSGRMSLKDRDSLLWKRPDLLTPTGGSSLYEKNRLSPSLGPGSDR